MGKRARLKGVTLTKRGDYQLQVYDKTTMQMKYVKRTQDSDAIAKIIDQKNKKKHVPKRSNTRLYSWEAMIQRFCLLVGIYTNDDGSLAVPSDLEASVDALRSCPLLSVCCPPLYFMSLMGKDGPWKRWVEKHWSQAFDLDASSSSSNRKSLRIRSLQLVEPCDLTTEDLMAVVRILQRSAVDAWGEDREDWDLNVGKNKLYFMGWQRMVTMMFVIRAGGRPPSSLACHIPRFL